MLILAFMIHACTLDYFIHIDFIEFYVSTRPLHLKPSFIEPTRPLFFVLLPFSTLVVTFAYFISSPSLFPFFFLSAIGFHHFHLMFAVFPHLSPHFHHYFFHPRLIFPLLFCFLFSYHLSRHLSLSFFYFISLLFSLHISFLSHFILLL